ncbi:MAG TPA: glycogen/starch/alpha-glucan phosphorylase [Patescibacteria group bacterium]|nr:glycogen/starch/alpha-glucan phosphorylase [Patescibacteria group bacterium]
MLKDKEHFKEVFEEKLQTIFGQSLEESSAVDRYVALASMIREQVNRNWYETNRQYKLSGEKQVYYFSVEFLMGRLLGSNLYNLGVYDVAREALAELGVNLDELEALEPDAGLGNGGLGRLAACFLDSMATLALPGHGCGLRYRHGLFEQKIINGYQVELPDNWLKDGYVWEVRKAERAVKVRFGGEVRAETDEDGETVFIHENYETVLAVPYDVPIVGHNNCTVNTLRLWSAETIRSDFDFSSFSRGDYLKAVEYKYSVEATSQILYPDDNYHEGRVLRLKQQYLFVSAGLQSIVRRFKKNKPAKSQKTGLHNLFEKVSIHINDTHPALAIPELMRILLDEEGMAWDDAWRITVNTISYTNHTILPEALEKWPVDLFKGLLPRIFMIVNEINERFCKRLWQRYPGDWDQIGKMAIIADGFVHMAHLAVAGSHSVNGVAAVHTEILKTQVMADFHEFFPTKFNNKTNGVTHRRWLAKANPKLAELISETIGTNWLSRPLDLSHLHVHATDPAFQEKFAAVKLYNKQRLAKHIQDKYGLTVDPLAIFDIHVKRIHAYKRQLLNVLHIMDLYNRLLDNPDLPVQPRVFIFGGKAAPGYYMAKRVIKLISTVAQKINNDPLIRDKIKVLFMENYSVSLAEFMIPAADVSEQISTASREASGTGNMKFMMNGAVTIGTLDGANIEIKEEVGNSNIIIFGLTSEQVLNYYNHGGYNSFDMYNGDPRIKRVVDQLVDGWLPADAAEFSSLYSSLLQNNDEYFVLKDFPAYVEAQNTLNNYYLNKEHWRQMAINNTSFSGWFSSDRTIDEYMIGIWKAKPVVVRSSGRNAGNKAGSVPENG